MKLSEYVKYDATGLAAVVTTGQVTPCELVSLARAAHDAVNVRINAVSEFYEDAETLEGVSGGLFHGVPFLRKDLGATEAGRFQERGSRLFKGCRSQDDSYFFQRARNSGLRTIGRTTTPEVGMSLMSESILHGITRNPWKLEYSTGGSSSGAAAAVAAGITPIAHANDGGGSIRIPASWCGLVGLNPSRGRVSGGPNNQDASFGLSRELVLCRTVRDMAAALDVFSGSHPGDPFIIVQPVRPYIDELSQRTGVLRVGVALTKWGHVDVEPEIRDAVLSTATLLEGMGHIVSDVEPPYESIEYKQIMLARWPFLAISLENEARALGRTIDANSLEPINLKLYEYGRNSRGREAELEKLLQKMRRRVGEAIQCFDILLTPTMPISALPHGGIYSTINPTLSADEFKEADAANLQYTGVFNVTGQPSVSLPLAQSASGLPIGVQIVGRFGDEATLVRIARDLEEARPWSHRRPTTWAGDKMRSL